MHEMILFIYRHLSSQRRSPLASGAAAVAGAHVAGVEHASSEHLRITHVQFAVAIAVVGRTAHAPCVRCDLQEQVDKAYTPRQEKSNVSLSVCLNAEMF